MDISKSSTFQNQDHAIKLGRGPQVTITPDGKHAVFVFVSSDYTKSTILVYNFSIASIDAQILLDGEVLKAFVADEFGSQKYLVVVRKKTKTVVVYSWNQL